MVSNTLLALTSLYWGVHNVGEPQRINIDHFTSGYVMGVSGEDIQAPTPISSSSKIIVAVLDTGIDSNNPALKGVLAGKGYNFVNNNDDTTDLHGHGTHISGVIATQVTQNALILPVKVVQTGPNAPIRPQGVEAGGGTALTENVAKGIVYAIQNGAKVINLSLAWPESIRSKKMDEAMTLAEQSNVLVIASAANDSTASNLYPCIYSNTICVGAHGPDGAMTYFSNYGSMVDILAPGIAILSTWPMNIPPVTYAGQIGYEFRNGTSMASPFVAGAAAELLSRGYSAQETKNRLLLGARGTRSESLYNTSVVGKFTKDNKNEGKFTRFGNLDITRALHVEPQSLILPLNKAKNEIQWNGIDLGITKNIEWKNNWKNARNIKISIKNQTFNFATIGEGEKIITPFLINLNSTSDSSFNVIATIEADEENGSHSLRKIPLSFSISRIISPTTIPTNADRYVFQGIDPIEYSSFRSVVNADNSKDREIYLLRKNEIVLTRRGLEIGRNSFANITEDKILNLYRLDQNTYSLISTIQNRGEPRPVFMIKTLNEKLELQSEIKLGTDITVLNEKFIWKKSKTGNSLFWLSIGITPTLEKPAYDPWNKDAKDIPVSRVYYLEGKDLHSIHLADNELPLQLLPNGDLLIAKGNGYFAQYLVLSIDLTQEQKIINRREISSLSYRMLIGLDGTNKVLNLDGTNSNSVMMVGASSPGNLRATTIDSSSASIGVDTILKRENTLDSLMNVSGAFTNSSDQFLFAQTHYDMRFFSSLSTETNSLSLNRYSYIPSMYFARTFFPILAKDESNHGIPAIYIQASIANSNVSEIILGNPKTGAIKKPALFHFETSAECSAMGNVIQATEVDPTKQVFICGKEVIMVPIVIQN